MSTDGPPAFGDVLRRLRLEAGLSQEALAERAGISVDAVAALERGRRRRPRPDTFGRIAGALGLRDVERVLLARAAADRPTPPGRLPAPPGSLIGRSQELSVLLGMLAQPTCRLLTLIGPGGVGKTRLALAAAALIQADHADGVAFVALDPLTRPGLVAPTVAEALALPGSGRRPAAERLLGHLADRDMLLVLDSFEHLLPAAGLVADLVAYCPELHVIVTSRAPLRLRAEQQLRVVPLRVPPARETRPRDLASYPAVKLFASRARMVQHDFTIDEAATATATARICRRLDGLPLAIELAASRINMLTPLTLAVRLPENLDALGEGARDLPERQRTLRATIDWSHALLPEPTRRVFAHLAVFHGGCTTEAALAVVGPDSLAPFGSTP